MKVEIKELFDLSEIPERIEIYDNKNLSLDLSYFYTVGTESIRTAERISRKNAFFKTLPK